MSLRETMNFVFRPAITAGAVLGMPALAAAQTSFVAPDGHNRFPAVTIFCPSGTGVAPCSFGGGGGAGGAVSINLGGGAVSGGNRFPVSDGVLDAAISGGALTVGGTVAVSGLPPVGLAAGANTIGAVAQAGSWMVNLGAGLPAGSNAIGSVSVSNLPATQAVSAVSLPLPAGAALDGSLQAIKSVLGAPLQQSGGTVTVGGLPPLAAGSNAIGSVSVSNLPATQAVSGSVSISGTVGVSALPALPAGGNTIGAVTIAGTPTFTCTGCSGGGTGGPVSQGAGASANPWWMQGLGTAGTPAGGVVSMQGVAGGTGMPVSGTFWQAIQPVSGTVSLAAGSNAIGSVSVSNLPATQAVSAASLPLPAGAALDASVQAVKSALGSPLQQSGGTVGVSSLPALPAGANAIGSVSVSNLPATQAVSAASLPLPAGAALDASVQAVKSALGSPLQQSGGLVGVSSLPALAAGANAIGSVSISNLPATQTVSAASLPLPAGAATAAGQAAALAPVAPAAATATSSVLGGCVSNTVLPSFANGQQGAISCDGSGRPYVVTVPSANNVPAFLQAVTAGGASVYRAINAASSTMGASVKAASGMIYGYEACNSGTGAAYLRLFALGTAPTVGTSVPQVSKLLPAGACQTMTTSIGLVFSSGIAVDVTSGSMADADTTAVATASTVSVSVYYK